MIPLKGASSHGELFFEGQLELLSERIEELVKKDLGTDKTEMYLGEKSIEPSEMLNTLPAEWKNKILTMDSNGNIDRKKIVLYFIDFLKKNQFKIIIEDKKRGNYDYKKI